MLDALDAYNQKLVKKIEVVGFELKNLKGTDGYLYLADIILSKDRAPQARMEMEIQISLAASNVTTRISRKATTSILFLDRWISTRDMW